MANEINIGICKTLNKAMQHVIGDYVCIISTDDVMKTNRIARQVALFKELSQDYGVIYTDAKVIDEKGKILHNSFIEKIRVDNIKPSGDIYEYLVIQNFIPIMTTMLSRNILNKIGPFDERLIYEDWDLWLRLSIVCKFYYLDVIGANYRVLSSSLVKNMGIKGVESTFLLTLKCLSNDNNHDTRSILEGRLLAMLIMIFKGRSRMRFYAFVKAFACHRRKIFMLSYLISGNTFVNKIINCYVVKCFRRSIVKIL
jgi:glycosyltransferase involved in cell wall biosynthesis